MMHRWSWVPIDKTKNISVFSVYPIRITFLCRSEDFSIPFGFIINQSSFQLLMTFCASPWVRPNCRLVIL